MFMTAFKIIESKPAFLFQNQYFNVLMNSLTVMAHKEIVDRKPSYFFDLREETSVRSFIDNVPFAAFNEIALICEFYCIVVQGFDMLQRILILRNVYF